FAVADNIVADHPRIRDRSVYLLVAIHPLPASEEGEFRNILLNKLRTAKGEGVKLNDMRSQL
ncbi:MAG: hypothetical protein KFF72_05560, partial [Arthrospira sp. SH-MAG29]